MIQTSVLTESFGIGFVIPVIDCDLNLTNNQKGFLSGIAYLGFITSCPLWGYLADTKGRRRVITTTLFLAFISSALSSVINNFWLLITARYINGFMMCASSTNVITYLGEFHPTKTRSRVILVTAALHCLGYLMLPVIAWLIINQTWSLHIPIINLTYKPWRLFLMVCGIPELISALCLLKLPETPKFVLLQDKHDEAIKILQNIYCINTGKSAEEFPVKAVCDDELREQRIKNITKMNPVLNAWQSFWNQTVPLFKTDLLRETVFSSVLQFGFCFTAFGMAMWFPTILNLVGDYSNLNSNTGATICEIVRADKVMTYNNETEVIHECNNTLDILAFHHTFILEILYVILYAVMGLVVHKVGKTVLIFILSTICGICGIVVVYIKIPIFATYLYLILLLSGCGVITVYALTVELFPTCLRAMAVCISKMIGRSGGVFGAALTGFLLNYSCEAANLTGGLLLILCGLTVFLIPKAKKPTTIPSP